MEETTVRCPECEARLRVPANKTAFRCPKCKATVRVPASEPDEEEEEERRPVRRPARREDPDDDEERPRARRPRRDEDDEDDRPRRRRDDDEDEDDRPRKKKKARSQDDGEGPWLLALAGAVGGFLLTFGGAFLVQGTRGLAEGQDGPQQKLIGLGIGFVVSLVLMPLGVMSVKNKIAYGRWHEVSGTMAIVLGMIQAVAGGLMGGFCLYGLIFAIINGR